MAVGCRFVVTAVLLVAMTTSDVVAAGDTDVTTMATTRTAEIVTTAAGESASQLDHVASTTSSITVRWKPINGSEGYRVEAYCFSSDVTLISPLLSNTTTEYTMPDLAVDTYYRLCLRNVGLQQVELCADLSTIATVRLDSILAVLIAIIIILLAIIIACICWRCARRRHEADKQPAPSQADGNNDQLKNSPPDEKSPLLLTPADKKPPPEVSSPNVYLYLAMAGKAPQTVV